MDVGLNEKDVLSLEKKSSVLCMSKQYMTHFSHIT